MKPGVHETPTHAGAATADLPPRPAVLPPSLARVLAATTDLERERAWAEFVVEHSGVLLHTCRALARDHDAAMDGYAYVLEALQRDSHHRLRAYAPDGRTRFTTWLVVVTRRLLLDYHRHRFGRARGDDEARRAEHLARRRLEELVGAEIDPEELTSAADQAPDTALRHRELADALREALEELEPSDRLLLALRFEDDRPVREIAAMLGMSSVFHVYRRIGTALSSLRRALARRGVYEAEP